MLMGLLNHSLKKKSNYNYYYEVDSELLLLHPCIYWNISLSHHLVSLGIIQPPSKKPRCPPCSVPTNIAL